VEADIYLRKGKLIVAHLLPCLKMNRTLEALYLKPLMEYIQQDECIEVTPKVIRMRKVILDEDERKKTQKSQKAEPV